MDPARDGTVDPVEVWAVDLDQPSPVLTGLEALLHPDERAAVASGTPPVRRRRLVVRAALVDIVGGRTGRPPATIRLRPEGEHGKPHIAGGPSVNVAHSGELGLVALAAQGPVGVDVEMIRPRPRLDRLAARVLDSDEHRAWAAAPAFDRLERFLRAWVRKEAHRKAEGVGLRVPLGALGATPPRGWRWHDLEPAPGYVGAVAVSDRTGGGAPRVRRWRPDGVRRVTP